MRVLSSRLQWNSSNTGDWQRDIKPNSYSICNTISIREIEKRNETQVITYFSPPTILIVIWVVRRKWSAVRGREADLYKNYMLQTLPRKKHLQPFLSRNNFGHFQPGMLIQWLHESDTMVLDYYQHGTIRFKIYHHATEFWPSVFKLLYSLAYARSWTQWRLLAMCGFFSWSQFHESLYSRSTDLL